MPVISFENATALMNKTAEKVYAMANETLQYANGTQRESRYSDSSSSFDSTFNTICTVAAVLFGVGIVGGVVYLCYKKEFCSTVCRTPSSEEIARNSHNMKVDRWNDYNPHRAPRERQ